METLKSKKTRIWMLVVILLMQVILPTLSVTLESALTLTSSASTEWDISATENDSVKAVFDDTTGTLTISGTGAMQDWDYLFSNYAPWYSEGKNIKKVIIEEGITNIGNSAFVGCSNLTEIIIPEGVTSIGRWTFVSCTSLTSIEIPKTVSVIENCAFMYWNGLTEIIIPEGVTTIESKAFGDCENLAKITIPSSVTTIESYAFEASGSLTEINVAEENEKYSSENGILYNKAKTEIICYPEAKAETKFEIPEGVTSIGVGAFGYCLSLTEITISEGVTNLGYSDNAFINCRRLKEIIVADGNEKYSSENGILYNKDKSIIICYPAGKTETKFEIPEGVTSIGEFAFGYCLNLIEITIPSSTSSVDTGAFYGCDNLMKITIPAGVTKIRDSVFGSYRNLTIYCQANSYAQGYAIENEIPYVLIVGDKLSLEAKLTTTISKMIEDMNTEGEIKVYKGETEVTDTNEKLATGMTVKITLGEDTEEYVITVTGDVNGDGEADIRDILAINKHRLNKTALEGAYLLAGYVTEDENVDIMDILQINKYRLGKIENL